MKSICYAFQTDSKIVNKVYLEENNYLIEIDEKGDKEWCAVYFCSNDIYYPNTEDVFYKRIVEKNFFEWYHSRIAKASKHIFVRDIFKQWYLAGINQNINTPEKLIEFLKKETEGYKVVTIGSSAGGYAAILYGSFINTQYTLAFNPQFEIRSLLKRSTEAINPLLFRIKDQRTQYFDIIKFINNKVKIFYFYSNASPWDMEQKNHINKYIPNLYTIAFRTKHHGIPFLKVAINKVINLNVEQIIALSKKNQNPIWFTIKMVGIKATLIGLYKQIKQAYNKRR